MLCFSAITPHPIAAIPTINKDLAKKIEDTLKSFKKLEEDLYVSKPDLIILISTPENSEEEKFLINLSPTFTTDLKEFGDLVTKNKFKGDLSLANKIYELGLQTNLNTQIHTTENLSYNFSIPLLYLTKNLPEIKILPISISKQDFKKHIKLGEIMKEIITTSNKRIAVIASGDMSHTLASSSPAGFNKDGKIFDENIQEFLNQQSLSGMLQMKPETIDNAKENIFRQILVLMSIMQNVNFNYKSLSYESPFGVGYLTANLEI